MTRSDAAAGVADAVVHGAAGQRAEERQMQAGDVHRSAPCRLDAARRANDGKNRRKSCNHLAHRALVVAQPRAEARAEAGGGSRGAERDPSVGVVRK